MGLRAGINVDQPRVTVDSPTRQAPSGGGLLTLQRKEEGQMLRGGGGGSGGGEMLTFSREQRCIEAAVASSLPPSLPSSASLPPSLFLSCSPLCRLTGMKSWLLIKTPHPASLPAILPTCSLHPFFLPPPLVIPPTLSHPPTPLLLARPPAVPAPSFYSPLISCELPSSSLSVILPSSLSSIFPSHLLLPPPLLTSTPTSRRQK